MKPEQIRARLAEITAALATINTESLTEEQITQINDYNTEFEGLKAQLEAIEKVEAMKAKASTSTRQVAPAQPSTSHIQVGASATDKFGGFKSSGEFLMAVKDAGRGVIHKNFQNTAYERNGEDGGFLIPEEMAAGITKKLQVSESLLASTNQLTVSGNSLSIMVDESQPWNQGVQAYWLAEGAQLTETKPKFAEASWKLNKLGAMVKATDELLDDATALESYIKTAAPEAIMYKINGAILNGDGVGKPRGLISSDFTVTASKESGQLADTVVARNVVKMYARMFPQARANAAWYINPQVEEQLMVMKDDVGNFIYLAPGSQMNNSPYGLLLGRPVIPLMSGLPALGDAGDIVFADLKYYYTLLKTTGVKAASSIHLHFDREITAFRFSMRIDGACPFKAPVTTEFGSYQMSAFVKLEDRA